MRAAGQADKLGGVKQASPPAPAACASSGCPAPDLSAERIEVDSIDGEASTSSRRGAQPRNWRRKGCCKNSSSSGYSSRSSGSAPAKAPPASLAVIREGEAIPRPIWPALQPPPPVDARGRREMPSSGSRGATRRPASIYNSGSEAFCSSSSGNGTSGSASLSSDYGRTSSVMTNRELLLELSRTLSAVLEGDSQHSAKPDREILGHISRSVAQRAPGQPRPAPIYEEIRPYAGESAISLVNPINSSLYQQRCHCARKGFLFQDQTWSPAVHQIPTKPDDRKRQYTPTVFLVPGDGDKSSTRGIKNSCLSCNCVNYLGACNATPVKLASKQILQTSHRYQSELRPDKDVRLNYPSTTPHDYTTLECSDSSSSEAGAVSKDSTWSSDFRGFNKNMDFTLDGFKAERLGRAIAKAKQRRQWCRVVVVIFGLVFFILSVVIVSLSVTKGRKVFGSM